jgi:hypothetical protein
MTAWEAGGMLLLGAGVSTAAGSGGGGAGAGGLLHAVMDTSTSDEAVDGGCSPPRGLTRAVRITWCSCVGESMSQLMQWECSMEVLCRYCD